MLAKLIGDLAVFIGLAILLLPLLLTELSRPRDEFVGAVLLILGLVLLISHERFIGSPTIAVCSGTFLVGKLGWEVGLSRWQKLSQDEKVRLGSIQRWIQSFKELFATFTQLGKIFGDVLSPFVRPKKPNSSKKKWVRPENTKEDKASRSLTAKSDEISHNGDADVLEQLQHTSEGHSPVKDS